MSKKRRRTGKERDQARHAKNRALERYDIDLTEPLRNHIKARIRASRLLFKQSNRVYIYAIKLSENIPYMWVDKEIPIVWDKQRQQIVSFLPQDALQGFCNEDDY